MSKEVTRREFMKESAGAAVALGAGAGLLQTGCATGNKKTLAATAGAETAAAVMKEGEAPSNQIRMGLIGCGGRGTNVMEDFMTQAEVRVVALCDPDTNRSADFAKTVEKKYGKRPEIYSDYRELLEYRDVDAVMVATPDHWHCLAACHACETGRDVYVEKPISHSIVEGRAMVNAARENNRIVQVGTQQRSSKHFKEAVDIVQSGALGQITLVRTWNYDYEMPGGLGMGSDKLPAGVDYDLWSGPAPLKPFNSNRFHYQWRWFFDYAGGMLCDWGIHLMDIAMWGMKARAPEWVSATGAKYAVPDNRDTPDTLEAVYQFAGTDVAPKGFVMTYSNTKACARGEKNHGYGIEFCGVNGSLFVDRGGFEIVPQEVGDKKDRHPLMEKKKKGGDTPTVPHIRNFLDCVKSRKLPVSDIEIGHRSTSNCQLANIAYRTGERLHWDAENEVCTNSWEANKLLGRAYRAPWDKEAKRLPLNWNARRLLA